MIETTHTGPSGEQVLVVDVRQAGAVPRYTSGKNKGGRRAYQDLRELDTIDAVCLHHLGPHLSADPRPGQTVVERAVWRALRQPYPVWVQPGLVVLAWDFRLVTWHGNGWNRRSIGLVVAGNYPSLESKREPEHEDPTTCADALDVALQRIREEAPRTRLLLTHSQSASKPADPGELVARLVTRSGAAMLPPLLPIPGLKIGNGRAWPAAWSVPLEPLPTPCVQIEQVT